MRDLTHNPSCVFVAARAAAPAPTSTLHRGVGIAAPTGQRWQSLAPPGHPGPLAYTPRTHSFAPPDKIWIRVCVCVRVCVWEGGTIVQTSCVCV